MYILVKLLVTKTNKPFLYITNEESFEEHFNVKINVKENQNVDPTCSAVLPACSANAGALIKENKLPTYTLSVRGTKCMYLRSVFRKLPNIQKFKNMDQIKIYCNCKCSYYFQYKAFALIAEKQNAPRQQSDRPRTGRSVRENREPREDNRPPRRREENQNQENR